jgi:hypothetical protein
VLFQQRTPQVQAWLAARQEADLDVRDEVWEGVYVVMNPAPGLRHGWIAGQLIALLMQPSLAAGLRVADAGNLGEADDYRIPDVVVYTPTGSDPTDVWLPTAAVAVEIRSPGEAHEEKLPFYAARHVSEVVLVDPDGRTVRWLALTPDASYQAVEHSAALDLDVERDVAARLAWD